MTDPIFGPFNIIILLIAMIHLRDSMIILVIWTQDYYYLDGGVQNGNEINN